MNRRNFLKNSLMTAATITTFAGLLIKPKRVFAAWPKESFDITDLNESIKSVYGHNNVNETSKIKLKAPDIAENGAIVPINVKSSLNNVESIMVFVDRSPTSFPTSRIIVCKSGESESNQEAFAIIKASA